MPTVSVVIPCFNLGAYLDEAVASVLSQTLTDVEIVIVDDGSTDPATCRLLDAAPWPHTLVVRTPNRGVAAARNAGIARCRGTYILPLDADDRISARYLEQAAAVLDRQPTAGIVYCTAELFGELQGCWDIPEFSLPHMLLDNLIFSAALFRREDWERVGGYRESMRVGWEDWDFWLCLLELGRQVVRLPEMLFAYRIRRGSRERSLTAGQRVRIMAGMVARHAGLYLRHTPMLVRILAMDDRRRPARLILPAGAGGKS